MEARTNGHAHRRAILPGEGHQAGARAGRRFLTALSRFYRRDESGFTTLSLVCRDCKGRRYVGGLICDHCDGNGRIAITVRLRSRQQEIRRNLGILVCILAGVLAGALLFIR
jgi:hypothetical protein